MNRIELFMLVKQEKLKYKFLSFDELIINLDRLSRFKIPEYSYQRVFNSIILKYLVYPKYSKHDVEKLEPSYISKIVKNIWDASVKNLFSSINNNLQANNTLKLLFTSVFKNIDEKTEKFLNTNLLISPLLKQIDYDSSPFNLKLLKKADEVFDDDNPVKLDKLVQLSSSLNLKFPVRRLLIVEGITEEILLPVFAHKLKKSFDKNGVFVLGAGGKSKSPDIYLEYRDKLKIPVILLFDSDAYEICDILKQNLLKKDKMIIIKDGEFEDILSLNLIKRSLNSEYDTISPVSINDLKKHKRMCENIEDYYRTRKLGEFKKSKLSRIIADNIKYDTDITNEISDIINALYK